MGKRIDLSNKRFGKLKVIRQVGSSRNGSLLWECLCDCGNTAIIRGDGLKSGHTQSCGCLRKEESAKSNTIRLTTHGMSGTRLYRIWRGMKTRCLNENEKYFKNYGGRGITLCEEWLNSFEAFYKWSLENGYSENLTLDRIRVNGNYSPDNCRWATYEEQQNNRRDNYLVTLNGETSTLANMCRKYGVNYHTVCTRIFRDGISPEDAIFKQFKPIKAPTIRNKVLF